MGMSLSIAKFEWQGDKLDANYKELSQEVVVTDFVDSIISEKYISFFIVFEDDEKVKYREVSKESLYKLSEEIDAKVDNLLNDLEQVSGKSRREETTSKIRSIILINKLIKEFLFNQCADSTYVIKFLIS
ncbi:hypothetical protein [Enterobacter quasiroggenkampii]|uniref:hypothetical protein n=1 Tax=Enterobacter quasiroggenkampii TaxID=2497436 RepID=UPI0021CF7829|nr:hypothetical protein [Enterobacter quasiroggenkampii]MCU6387192.1 hypothetical protein [Enterobacter quasiroggenkampii]MCU6395646.1 hypothetical protein [Enterobacter quasiroggenkampii]MCU6405568.1 hypothetical protein [Enterobacter quasiroggenkampii]MCU6418410.1 hypothetical protein [Enterobacter quasiroggenkampii]